MTQSGMSGLLRHCGRAASMVLLALALAGCASKVRLDAPAPVEDRLNPSGNGSATAGNGAAQLGGTNQSRVAGVDLAAQGGAGAGQGAGAGKAALAGNGRVVYFDFDSYVVRDDDRGVIDANAKWLNADRRRGMLIEGHTDSQGGSEYNLALGQKRAESVSRALTLLGVKDAQIEAVSYGKERPAMAGSGEAVWAKNRRVELKDR
ncbi:MAG: peptidoglycan-associated lipoprotein Pal [Leptothrix sp. (in: b-proteobacteria)]